MASFLDKTSIFRNPSCSMPIGLVELSSYLFDKINKIDIKLLDMGKDLYKIYIDREITPGMSAEFFIDRELDSIDYKPDIVGISIMYSTSHISSMKVIDKVKEKWRETIVVCGGNHATNCLSVLFSNPNVDYVVRGEGELSFTEFIRKIQIGENDPDVFGIINRDKLNSAPLQLSPLMQNLDDISISSYNLLDIETYRKRVGASIMFTRGCPFQCTFCASHTVHGDKVRFKSNDRILKELVCLVEKYNFRYIIIEDDLFAARKEEFIDLANRIIALNIPLKYRFPQGLSVAVLDEDIIDAMARIGIDEAQVAVESGSPFTQKYIIKKNVSLPKARRLLQYLRKKDFFVYTNFMFGFSGETRELMQETIDFINTLDVDWVFIFHALALPGSEMFKELVSMGTIDPSNIDWDGMRIGRRTLDTKDITAAELDRLTYDLNIDRNFFNNPNLKHGRYERAVEVFNRFIIKPYPFHIVGCYCRGLAYLGMNQKEKAVSDFKECIKWIYTEKEAKRLYDRYGSRMPYLKPYFTC